MPGTWETPVDNKNSCKIQSTQKLKKNDKLRPTL